MLPSLRDDQLGSRIVHLTRLQASLHVAARVLASLQALRALQAFDVPLGTRRSLVEPGTCYPALRRLPGRASFPLKKRSERSPAPKSLPSHHDAPSPELTPRVIVLTCDSRRSRPSFSARCW